MIERYVFEDKNGHMDNFSTFDINEAKTYARDNSKRLIAQVFECTDSELVEDYTRSDEEENE